MKLAWRRLKYVDEDMFAVSQLFFLDAEEPTLGKEALNAANMDYSIESLSSVNKYLDEVRRHPNIEAEWNKVVLRCGAYVGEVVKKNSVKRAFHWLDYRNAVRVDKQIEAWGLSISTACVLYGGKAFLCFPLGKVEKYLENGAEDNLQSFARVAIDFD